MTMLIRISGIPTWNGTFDVDDNYTKLEQLDWFGWIIHMLQGEEISIKCVRRDDRMILYEYIRQDLRCALELEKGTNGVYIFKMTSSLMNSLPSKMRTVFRICMNEQEFEGVLELMYQARLGTYREDDE